MRGWFAAIGCLLPLATAAEVLVPQRSTWQYLKGTSAPSDPATAWREAAFPANTWSNGGAPLYYGETLGAGTQLSDMQNAYTTFYARRYFNIFKPAEVDRLALRVRIDDGYIAWINGREVARFNVPAGEQPPTGLAQASIEATWTTNSLANPAEYLVAGPNLLAVHVFNSAANSTDIVFDLELESTTDNTAPTVSTVQPPAGHVSQLTSVTFTFSEPVQGVFAEDLLINNTPAQSVTGSGTTYTYTFTQPDFGPVDITFDAGHRITDLASPPHAFDSTVFQIQYDLWDRTPPEITSTVPPPGNAVRQLSSIDVKFSELVTGIDAEDLLIEGVPATNVIAGAGNTYTFQFPPQPDGTIDLSWAVTHGIRDLGTNSFSPGEWFYLVDANLPIEQVVISEFLAAAENAAGLKDEDGELQDWIELHNTGGSSVNLDGWSLTDDPEEPGLWTFPNISLAPGARLVVFASGKDRKPTTAGGRLHTNFKLSNGGEYLALFNAASPRAPLTEFRSDYPEQRNDYSYGTDTSGAWRYFQVTTPGQPNGTSSISGVVPKAGVSHKRGWYEVPFTLALTNLPGTSIRYTTDGSIPTETTGSLYSSPLQVSSNLVLRAIAFRANHLPSEILTHTYLFPAQVLQQPNDPAGFPIGSTVQAGYPSDYEMDPEIVNDPLYAPQMKEALLALPIMAISIKMEDMFGAANGIYTHPLNRGSAWERVCSVEFIPPDGKDFQVDAGIQIQGNAAREPIKTPKHPMRVTFKGDYGPKKLDYRMFPDSPVSSFDTLILRADFGYSWLHWNPAQRSRAQRIRDAWVKDSMRAMGGLASHNRYVHLFINGVYWGIYDPTERPDGSFGEAYLGGEKEDYDVINEGAVVDGSATAYNAMLAVTDVSTLDQYAAMKAYLDIPQFIDYMLLHFFIGHEDWFNNKNWYAIRPKDGSRGFRYIPWDGENVLVDQNANRVTQTDLPSRLHPKLVANAQYRMDFADRVQQHFFNNGALMPAANISRWQKRAREMELPIIAESARWGDYRRDVHSYQSPPYELYTREEQYRSEQNRLLNSYFPNRTATVLTQLKAAGLYPAVAAPTFSQNGGKIEPGFLLSITAPAGAIYYTTNGVDPRIYGTGAISSEAKTYGGPIPLITSTLVKARVFSGGNWSALTEARFTTESPRIPLRITEIMYNPDPTGDAYEFIEVQNFSPLPFEATGFYIEGVDFIFPPQSILAPGQIIVLGSAENPTQFAVRYPGVAVYGRFGGQILNRGERLALVAPNGRIAQSIDFKDEDGWPEGADGDGFSLEIANGLGDPDDPANWQASATLNGTPGLTNSAHAIPMVVINEVNATVTPDWIELYNPGSGAVDLSHWTLRDEGNTNVFTFPTETTILANGFVMIECDPLITSADVAKFGISRQGETLVLRKPSGEVVDVIRFGPQVLNRTVGRLNGSLELTLPTPGQTNLMSPLGSAESLVINEWLANPVTGQSDWVEIHNVSTELPVALRGMFLSVSNQVFEIPSATFVGPGGHVQLFADEGDAPDSVDFKLPASGATIELLDESGNILDSITFDAQTENISEGRYPDATDNIITFPITPSPGGPNQLRFPLTVGVDAEGIILSWPSAVGRVYRIEGCDDLSNWTSHGEVTASGGTTIAGENFTGNSRYFRVVALP